LNFKRVLKPGRRMNNVRRVAVKVDAAAAGAGVVVGVNAANAANAQAASNQPNAQRAQHLRNAQFRRNVLNAVKARHWRNPQLRCSVQSAAARLKPKFRRPCSKACRMNDLWSLPWRLRR
jgi:hypothetical protein